MDISHLFVDFPKKYYVSVGTNTLVGYMTSLILWGYSLLGDNNLVLVGLSLGIINKLINFKKNKQRKKKHTHI